MSIASRILKRWSASVAQTFDDDTEDVFTFVLIPNDLVVMPRERLFVLMEQAGVEWDFSTAEIPTHVPEDWS